MAYDNDDLLQMLKVRGSAFAAGSYEKVKAAEEKINESLEKNFEKYNKPVSAFIIWERQEGHDRCIRYLCPKDDHKAANKFYLKTKDYHLWGEPIDMN